MYQFPSLTSLLRILPKKIIKCSFISTSSQNCSPDEKQSKFCSNKYKIFNDNDSPVVYNVEEERARYQKANNDTEKETNNPLTSSISRPFDSKRNDDSFEVTQLVNLLKTNKGKDTCVINIPPHLKYVNYMIVTTGISQRHLIGLAELVRKEFKLIRKSNLAPQIEGADSDWIALDLDSIVLHLMMESVRKKYDLESLWAISAKYDPKLKIEENHVLQILKHRINSLDGL